VWGADAMAAPIWRLPHNRRHAVQPVVAAMLADPQQPVARAPVVEIDQRRIQAGDDALDVQQDPFDAGRADVMRQQHADGDLEQRALEDGRRGAVRARERRPVGENLLLEAAGLEGEQLLDLAVAEDRVIDLMLVEPRRPAPAGVQLMVGGDSASTMDEMNSLRDRLPLMLAIMALVTLGVLLVAFRSALLPIKAVLTNVASIGATFGALVWIFQDGHLAGLLGFTPTGHLEPTVLILILAELFGLATDYEVFLLSRVREQWDATGDNTTAVATGLQRTGRIITAAAALLIVVTAGFATGQIVVTKLIGVGMVVGILLDATLIRALLVPATMRLLGRWNWWAPPGFRRRQGSRPAAAPAGAELDRQPALVD